MGREFQNDIIITKFLSNSKKIKEKEARTKF